MHRHSWRLVGASKMITRGLYYHVLYVCGSCRMRRRDLRRGLVNQRKLEEVHYFSEA